MTAARGKRTRRADKRQISRKIPMRFLLRLAMGTTSRKMNNPMSAPQNTQMDQAIVTLLHDAPHMWASVPTDRLSATDERAVRLLTSAALVEQRFEFRLSLIGHPVQLKVTATATGEYGLAEAMEPVLRQAWEPWAEFYREHLTKPADERPRFFCEKTGPTSWRLTPEGVQAQQDLADGHTKRVLDFVQKRTAVFYGLVVRGYGKAERIEQIQAKPAPTQVEVTNLEELSSPLAQVAAMMQQMFERMGQGQGPMSSGEPNAADAKSDNGSRRGPERMCHDQAWRYLSTVQAWATIQQQNAGKPQRQRKRKNTFARELNLSVKDLNAMLAWYRKYHKKGLFPEDPQALSRDQLGELFV